MLQVTFDHPAALVSLAAVLVPLALAARASRHGRPGRPAGLILQCMAIVACGLAVAGPALPLGREVEKPYLLLQDRSASVRGQSADIPWDQGLPRQDYSFAAGLSPADAPLDKGASLETRAAPALLLAAARADDVAGVIIHTDGQFHDDWPGAAAALGRTGVGVLVAPMDSPPRDGRIADLVVTRRRDGKADLRAVISSNAAQRRTVTIRRERDGKVLLEKDLNLLPGDSATMRLTDAPAAGEAATYTAELSPADDFPENDSASAVLLPKERRIAVIGDDSGKHSASLAEALGVSVAAIAADKAPGDADGWMGYCGVLILRGEQWPLGQGASAGLAEYVRGGGGLVLVGSGPRKGPADYHHPVNRVAALVANPYQRRPMSLTVVLDSSGSMAGRARSPGPAGRGIKFDQAVQAVMALKQHLTAGDTLRVITFSHKPRLIYDSAAGRPNFPILRDALLGVRPAGPTKVAPALELATAAGATGRRKGLVLLVSDLMTQPFDAAAMAERFRQKQMSLAVVAIVPRIDSQPDEPPLSALARHLKAPLVRTNYLVGLAEVFAEFLSGARGEAVHRGSFRPVATGSPFGLDARALPDLDAYILAAPQEGAEVLVHVGADPLLARRRAGLGRSVTLALPPNDKNQAWWRSQFGASLLPKAMQWAMRAEHDSRFTGQIAQAGGRLRIRIDARDASGPINLLNLTAHVQPLGDGTVRKAALRQVAPGQYEGLLEAPAGAGSGQVQDASGRIVWQDAISGRYPRELAAIGADWQNLRRLADLTGGRIIAPDEIPATVRRSYRRASLALWPVLLGVAIFLMLLEWALSHLGSRRRSIM